MQGHFEVVHSKDHYRSWASYMNFFNSAQGKRKVGKDLLTSLQPLLTFANFGLTYFMIRVIKLSQQFLYLHNREYFYNNYLLKYSQPFQKDLADKKDILFPWLFILITYACTIFLVCLYLCMASRPWIWIQLYVTNERSLILLSCTSSLCSSGDLF